MSKGVLVGEDGGEECGGIVKAGIVGQGSVAFCVISRDLPRIRSQLWEVSRWRACLVNGRRKKNKNRTQSRSGSIKIGGWFISGTGENNNAKDLLLKNKGWQGTHS